MSYDTARPYLASFVLLRKGSKIALLLRSHTGWMDGFYGLPAGKAEVGERASTAAVREAYEEAGVTVKESDLRLVHVSHRKADDDTVAWIDLLFETNVWEGKAYNAEPHKHSELVWFKPDLLPDNIIPAGRFFLEHIAAGKVYSEHGW
ncbi:MAG TPA: NUDIX domain-containing protein [Candidatus Saccharimonadales bacterium]|nr:NUDIX domain-containing protein [Candidatus Saccharimonadales bacterium]